MEGGREEAEPARAPSRSSVTFAESPSVREIPLASSRPRAASDSSSDLDSPDFGSDDEEKRAGFPTSTPLFTPATSTAPVDREAWSSDSSEPGDTPLAKAGPTVRARTDAAGLQSPPVAGASTLASPDSSEVGVDSAPEPEASFAEAVVALTSVVRENKAQASLRAGTAAATAQEGGEDASAQDTSSDSSSLEDADEDYMMGRSPTPKRAGQTFFAHDEETADAIIQRMRRGSASSAEVAGAPGARRAAPARASRPASATPVLSGDRRSKPGGGAPTQHRSLDQEYEAAGIPEVDAGVDSSSSDDEEERVLFRSGSVKRHWLAEAWVSVPGEGGAEQPARPPSRLPPVAAALAPDSSMLGSSGAPLPRAQPRLPAPPTSRPPMRGGVRRRPAGQGSALLPSAAALPLQPDAQGEGGAARCRAPARSRLLSTSSFRLQRMAGGGHQARSRPTSAPPPAGTWDGHSTTLRSTASADAPGALPLPQFRQAAVDAEAPRLSAVRPHLRRVVLPLVGALQQHAAMWADTVLPSIVEGATGGGQGLALLDCIQEQVEGSWEAAMQPLEQSILSTTCQLASIASVAGLPEARAPRAWGGDPDPTFLPLAMFCRLVAHSYNKLATDAMGEGRVLAAHAFLEAAEDIVRTYVSQFSRLQLGHLLAAWTLMGNHGTDLALAAPQAAAGGSGAFPALTHRKRPPSASTLMAAHPRHRRPVSASTTGSLGSTHRRKAANVTLESAGLALLGVKGVDPDDIGLLHTSFEGSLPAAMKACYEGAMLLQATAGGEAFSPGALAALAVTYNNLGVLFHQQGYPSRALAQFHRALAVEEAMGHMATAVQMGRPSQAPLPTPEGGDHGSSQTLGNLAAVYQEAANALVAQATGGRGGALPSAKHPFPGATRPLKQAPRRSSRRQESHRQAGAPHTAELSRAGLSPLHAVSAGRRHMADALFPLDEEGGVGSDLASSASEPDSAEQVQHPPAQSALTPPSAGAGQRRGGAAQPVQYASPKAMYASGTSPDPARASARHDRQYARFRGHASPAAGSLSFR